MTGCLTTIENKISDHEARIAELRQDGARAAADQEMSGQDILKWLKTRGMSDLAARKLCVEIIHERRAARSADAASDGPEVTR